jgi:hypothetical protein
MNALHPSDLHLKLLEFFRPKLQPWRAMTVAVDGIDHAGKSSLARYLAWQLGVPQLETDLFLTHRKEPYTCDANLLKKFVDVRHDGNRPVIVEGVFVLRKLLEAGIDPDLVVRVESRSRPTGGTWPTEFARYEADFPRTRNPDFQFVW